MSAPAFRRIRRRETHSPRTVALVIVVILSLAALVYVGIEIVLFLLSQPALLVGPGVALAWLVALPELEPAWLVAVGGIVLAVLGVVLVWLALAPGRLSKHTMDWDGRAVVVDNGVIASALAQHLSDETGISRDEITVGVSHRTVDVTVRPALGVPLDIDPVRDTVAAEVSTYRLTPSVKTRVRVVRSPREEAGR